MTDTLPWIAHYPAGVRWDAELPRFAVHDMLFESVERYGERPMLDFLGRTLSYAEAGRLVRQAAAGLQRLGVGPGVHVGLFLPNTPHYFIAFYGVLAAGGTVVNYSPLDAAQVLAHKIEDSRTEVLVTLGVAALYPQMAALLGGSRLKTLVVGEFGEFSAAPGAVAADLRERQQHCEIPDDDPRQLRFAALLDNDGAFTPHPVADPAATLAVLQYTGGTTGEPKGAMLTHGNLSAACEQVMTALSGDVPVLRRGEERFLVVLPLFHIYALVAAVLLGVRLGAHMFLQARFDPAEALRTLGRQRITIFHGVPTMYAAMVSHPEAAGADFSSLRHAGSGGAPIPDEVARRFQALAGLNACDGWGMTETCALGTLTPTDAPKTGSCGMPAPNIRIRFASVDDPEKPVPYGERGEICIQGPNVMLGYWNKPEANRAAFTADGYFRTGDVGLMDADGYLRIVDRTKDMLLCSGYNVYPRVIEEAIYQHPSVEEACVIGIPDAYRGQSPKAFVKLRTGAPTLALAELQEFLKPRLGKHEMIGALELRDALPKTPVGKLSKRELLDEEARRRAAGGGDGGSSGDAAGTNEGAA